ncbi:ATP-dependent zinc protease family protein [Vibrio gallicus]|uniref:ATP-dependent zinc protease family protein n=1 Tax=Vibrio gallicus TaxID=190897 RepID=UPI0021C3F84E|nr:ATP-dependent zinc protease [Vibrio gallicus]
MKYWKSLAIAIAGVMLGACSSAPTTSQDNGATSTPSFEQETEESVEVVDEVKEPEVKKEPVEAVKVPLPSKTKDGKLILGEKEWVYFPKSNRHVRARIDSGATTSSLSAVDVKEFERDGKKWVKFKPAFNNKVGKELSLPVERWAKIKQSSTDSADKRAVVSVWIQLGDLKEKTEFTLVDRSHLSYPVLLGRSFVRDVAIVDVSRKYVQPKVTK